MISPIAVLTALKLFLGNNGQQLLSYHNDEPITGGHRQHTRALEKIRRRMRKASQRWNRTHD